MNLTDALKQWLVENMDVKSDASDDEFSAAAGKALAEGKLSPAKLTELSETKETKEASAFSEQLKGVGDGITEMITLLKEQKAPKEEKPEEGKETKTEGKKEEKPEGEKGTTEGKETKTPEPSRFAKMISRIGGNPVEPDEENKTFDVRVKEAADMYATEKRGMTFPSTTKSGKKHPLAGRPVMSFHEKGRVLDEPSELDKAVSGAYAKLLCATAQRGGSRTFGFQSLPQHDKELVCWAMENAKWSGSSDGGNLSDIVERKLSPTEQKALIDDASSGGLEAAPIVFDDQVIQTPLLHGELFPLVNQVPLDRGRRIEGVSTGTVTGSWGGVDDTSISLFNTASYVSAFDTTIFRWEGAIRIGLDFLSDTPIDFGAHISGQYGERLLEDLDDVVASGNGTTQPEGVINKSGTTSIAFGGSTTLGNYESLRFGVSKAEHRSTVANSAVFAGTETSYQRARAINVGSSDARRIFGMDHFGQDYNLVNTPFKINESLTNQQIFYAILARYRMYRRRGLTMRTSTEGDTLIRRNEMLMVAMARYGGQLERGAVAAVTTDAPS